MLALVMGYYAAFATGFIAACLMMAYHWWRDQRDHPTPPKIIVNHREWT